MEARSSVMNSGHETEEGDETVRHADYDSDGGGNPAPVSGIAGRFERAGNIAAGKFGVDLSGIDYGYNAGRKTAQYGDQDGGNQVIRNVSRVLLSGRNDYSGRCSGLRAEWWWRLQCPATLNASRGIIGIPGTALCAEHPLYPP